MALVALATLAALLSATSLLAPLPADAVGSLAPQAPAQTEVGGQIITNTVWAAGTYHAGEPVVVVQGVTLTIQSGVRVEFGETASLEARGGLIVEGSSPSDIEFTSDKAEKAKGDWPGIVIAASGSARMRGFTIRHAGRRSGGAALEVGAAGVAVEQAAIADSGAGGISFENVGGAVRNTTVERVNRFGIRIRPPTASLATLEVTGTTIDTCGDEAVLGAAMVQPVLSGNHVRGCRYNGYAVGSGSIADTVTWPGGDMPIVVLQTVSVMEPSREPGGKQGNLILAPDAVVKFADAAQLRVVSGGLVAEGTEADPIFLTSVNDDDACSNPGEGYCDTNNDQRQTTPGPGTWAGLMIEASAARPPSFKHVEIRYPRSPAIGIKTPGVRVSNVRVMNVLGVHGVHVYAVPAEITDSHFEGVRNPGSTSALGAAVRLEPNGTNAISVTLRSNTFVNNDVAVLLFNPNVVLLNSNNQAPGFTNGINGYVVQAGPLADDNTWRAGDLPFVLDGTLRVAETKATLVWEPGLLVKMGVNGDVDVERGELIAGTPGGAKVLVTSLRDDACSAAADTGCDTNGNGNQNTPTPGSWNGLAVRQGSKGATFNNLVMRYGGDTNAQAMLDMQHDGTLSSVELAYSSTSGLRVYQVTAATIANNNIHHNQQNGIVLESQSNQSSVVTLRDNLITDNEERAIDADANVELITEGSNNLRNNTYNGIVIRGDSSRTHTWRHARGIPYIILTEVRVSAKSTLTMEPGVVVKFGARPGTQTVASIMVYAGATLVARGTTEERIVFTSLKDDVVNDSNPRQGDVSPSPGDWRGLEINSDANFNPDVSSEFRNVDIRYTGAGSAAALQIEHERTIVAALHVQHGAGPGIRIANANASVVDTEIEDMTEECIDLSVQSRPIEPRLQGNRLTRCSVAVLMNANVQPQLSGNTASDNSLNGILVSGRTTVNRRWQGGDLPFVLSEQRVTVGDGTELSIDAGGLVKSQLGGGLNVDGKLTVPAPSSGEGKVWFTSLRDDTCGEAEGECDTNNDGATTRPRPGDWEGIAVSRMPAAFLSMRRAHVDYGGGTYANVRIQHDNVTIEDSEIWRSGTSGVFADGARITLRTTLFHGNVIAGLTLAGAAGGTFDGNVFTDNGRSIVHRGTSDTVMRNNVAVGNAANPMLYCATVSTSQTWLRDLPREIDCVVRVTDGTLTLEPGLVTLFWDRQLLSVDKGRLQAEGVIFTAASAEPKPNSWGGVVLGANSDGGYVRHSWLTYGGRDSEGMIDVASRGRFDIEHDIFSQVQALGVTVGLKNVPMRIQHNLFRDFGKDTASAIQVEEREAQPVIEHNRFSNVETGITTARGAQPQIALNNLAGTIYGVRNKDTTTCVSATRNWWGDVNGPTDRSGKGKKDNCQLEDNPDGRGVMVTDNVNYVSWLRESPPQMPMVDGPRCGVTSVGRQSVTGSTTPGATVKVYDYRSTQPDVPIATANAESNGHFDIPVDLTRGEHRLFVVAERKTADGNTVLKSAGAGFRVIDVRDNVPVDPMGIQFEWGGGGSTWLQPLRDEAGCAIACGGASSGRVTLPPDTFVRARIPVSGSPTKVEFRQEGISPEPMTYDGVTRSYVTAPFKPVQGTFTIAVEGAAPISCMGFVYLGALGTVYGDVGVTGEPAQLQDGRPFVFDFETEDQRAGWAASTPWDITSEKAQGGTKGWSDSPGGKYAAGLEGLDLRAPGPIDISTVSAPQLVFFHQYRFGRGDRGTLEVRRGDSGTWEMLREYRNVQDQWTSQIIALDDYALESRLWLRWVIRSDRDVQDDGWYIDTVSIVPGGALNRRFDRGEPTLAEAEVRLERQNLDTGEWLPWDGLPTGQNNPQRTDANGQYGFFYLEPGLYRIVAQKRGSGLYTSPAMVVWDGAVTVDAPLVGSEGTYLPVVLRRRGM